MSTNLLYPKPPCALIDTHCHIDLYPDPHEVVREIERARVYTIAVTNTPSVFDRLCEIVGSARYVRVALGLHPQLAVDRHSELNLFKTLLYRTRYVGEVGLDYQTSAEDERVIQRRVFSTILQYCDEAGDKILTVHSRRAADDVIDAIGPMFRGRYILHWYSGSASALRRAIANGAFISVNPAMIRSKRSRTLLRDVPRERVITETDGPFVSVGAISAHPYHVELVVDSLAKDWDVSTGDVRTIIHTNLSSLLHTAPL